MKLDIITVWDKWSRYGRQGYSSAYSKLRRLYAHMFNIKISGEHPGPVSAIHYQIQM